MTEQFSVIGSGMVLKGTLEGEEDVQVLGRVEGTIAIAGALLVELGAVVSAEIHARQAVIRGAVQGDIVVEELVHLGEEARVVGNITASRVAMDEGAQFSGRITMAEEPAPLEAAASPVRTAPRMAAEAQVPVRAPVQRPAPAPRRAASVATKRPAPARSPELVDDEPVGMDKPPSSPKPQTEGSRPEPRSVPTAPKKDEPPTPVSLMPGSFASPLSRRMMPGRKPPKPPTAAGKKVRTRRK